MATRNGSIRLRFTSSCSCASVDDDVRREARLSISSLSLVSRKRGAGRGDIVFFMSKKTCGRSLLCVRVRARARARARAKGRVRVNYSSFTSHAEMLL